jgi:hypothetical protein
MNVAHLMGRISVDPRFQELREEGRCSEGTDTSRNMYSEVYR